MPENQMRYYMLVIKCAQTYQRTPNSYDCFYHYHCFYHYSKIDNHIFQSLLKINLIIFSFKKIVDEIRSNRSHAPLTVVRRKKVCNESLWLKKPHKLISDIISAKIRQDQ